MCGQVFVIALRADHGAVVAAEAQRRHKELKTVLRGGLLEIGADAGIGRDAAGHDHFLIAQLLRSLYRAGHQAVADRFGEGGGQACPVDLLALLLGVVHQVDDRGLQAGKAHVIGASVHMADGENILGVVPALRELVDGLSAGIGQAQHAGGLIEALPRRVVPGRAQDLHVRIIPHVHQDGVAAGDGQA